MRLLLVLMMLLALVPLPALGAGEDRNTIRVLVPTSNAPPQLQNATSRAIGWTRVEVPIVDGRTATLDRLREEFGPEVIVEQVYELFDPADEPFFEDQWALENTGQTGGIPDADIDAEMAWTVATGTGVTVAVIDSGVDDSHPDLIGRVDPGRDTVDEDADPTPEGAGFDEAHGTMVAGVIASASNGVGVAGVAPDSTILSMRACSGGECLSLDVAEAVYLAVDLGADILNLSLGSEGAGDPLMSDAIEYARLNDVIVVTAIGNDSEDADDLPNGDIVIPAGLPHDNIVSVAASDDRDLRASFSNYGFETVDLFAPGEIILTAATAGLGPYEYVSGTSFAAPIVSGVAALLLSHDPGIGYQELVARVNGFTDDKGGLTGLSQHGRVNAGTTLTERFIDTSSSVFHNTIKWLADQGITEGCNPPQNHEYCPGDNVTRGQMAVFFARAFDLAPTSTDYFDDDDGRFYENSANMMAAAGITVGCDTNRFCGDRNISRGEMAAMLARVLSLPPPQSDHFDDDAGSTFEGAINRIAEANITQGCNPPDNDMYCPLDDVNRGQMAAFIRRSVTYPN